MVVRDGFNRVASFIHRLFVSSDLKISHDCLAAKEIYLLCKCRLLDIGLLFRDNTFGWQLPSRVWSTQKNVNYKNKQHKLCKPNGFFLLFFKKNSPFFHRHIEFSFYCSFFCVCPKNDMNRSLFYFKREKIFCFIIKNRKFITLRNDAYVCTNVTFHCPSFLSQTHQIT